MSLVQARAALGADVEKANWTVIGAFAAGIPGIVRGLALDLKPLRFNAVSPGLVDTELWRDMPTDAKKKFYHEAEQKNPTGAVAQASDVAESFVYLMRDYNTTVSALEC